MEDNNDSLSILGSRSLARSENSLAIVDKLLLERTNRDSIKAEYFFNLGLSRPFDENAVAIKDFNKAIELRVSLKTRNS